ncbi:MAG: iron-containing alcohol dehydrogenase [Acholeplasmatales bacterium]|nr:iron-containing alcohol dehydrogenase [Acholeplasmatales bacterium]
MRGNFMYYNPTKLYFGKDALSNLKTELNNYGKNVLLMYGGGSIKKNGIYDAVIQILKECNKNIFEDAGIMSNPTTSKLYEGIKIARDNKIDLILAVGGGSVIDYAKGVSASVNLDSSVDPWEEYYVKQNECMVKPIPVGTVLTMVGTGSEMNGGSVITNVDANLKIGKVFGAELFPKFTILNPEYTFSVPRYQMVAGIFDIMSHIMEQYFSDEDDNTSDYIMEGLMRSLITSSKIAVKNELDYDARSNIMWTATWALNTLVAKGKSTDWEVHMIGQAIGAVTNATHGMTLSAISIPYYCYIMPYALPKFKRFAMNVWNVSPFEKTDDGVYKKTDKEIAQEGIIMMSDWMKELGLVMHIAELGVNEDMFGKIVEGTFLLDGGYKTLTPEEVIKILKASM